MRLRLMFVQVFDLIRLKPLDPNAMQCITTTMQLQSRARD